MLLLALLLLGLTVAELTSPHPFMAFDLAA
jgi:hypothetical protein